MHQVMLGCGRVYGPPLRAARVVVMLRPWVVVVLAVRVVVVLEQTPTRHLMISGIAL